MTDHAKTIQVGDSIEVLPQYDIPPILRGGKPSEGIVERIDDDAVVAIVDGKAVPYAIHEVVRRGAA